MPAPRVEGSDSQCCGDRGLSHGFLEVYCARLRSQVCDCEIIVVRGSGDRDLRCGGRSLVPFGATSGAPIAVDPDFAGETALGKRYTNTSGDVEVLVTKSGTGGALSVGADQRQPTQSKPLPASD